MNNLFSSESSQSEEKLPLAVRMRPKSLEEFVGQNHLVGEGKLLRRSIEADRLTSLIFWGPPGSGKTSLAEIISQRTKAKFIYLNGNFCGTPEIKKELSQAHLRRKNNFKTLLFIDEIHRLNKLQQDALIADTETSSVVLIGATTYNPFFYIIPALVSRSLICEFKPLTSEEIILILQRALQDKERGLGRFKIKIAPQALKFLAENSSGDARKALTALELGVLTTPQDRRGVINFSLEVAKESIQFKPGFYDKKGDYHYDVISAFIKSVRGSDVDSALYWLARMLYSGEDPRFIARRLVILASEDIGLADPQALVLATSGFKAVEVVGMPEARIILSEVTIYLSCAPKSNSSYLAIERAYQDIGEGFLEEVPPHLKDSHAPAKRKTPQGKDYKYPHDFGGYVEQKYRKSSKKYYFPKKIGKEKEIFESWSKLKSKKIENS
ncbi:MAG: replication-associated recombination protein A [Candidatus Omnitrophota bacterium]|nr:MAG: replication-associated recombination protein A [Candidatus Omnitrophota bacterium]RKY35827.1 MAG: replication-associated recombination protein A [Candidatus Omnitrophota bacterium]